jgi:hypothetical protein
MTIQEPRLKWLSSKINPNGLSHHFPCLYWPQIGLLGYISPVYSAISPMNLRWTFTKIPLLAKQSSILSTSDCFNHAKSLV